MVPRRKAAFSGCSDENCVMMSLSTMCCVAVRRLFLAAGFSIETFSGHKDKSALPPRATDSNSWESSAFKILEMGAFKHFLDLERQTRESMEIFLLLLLVYLVFSREVASVDLRSAAWELKTV